MRDTVTAMGRTSATAPAAVIALVAAATLATVWTLQARGYVPCELCLKERIPYSIAIVPAAVLALLGSRVSRPARRLLFALLTLLFVGGAALGAYHAGVEWKLWAGPTECSGAANAPADVEDFMKQLKTVAVVRCDAAAFQVLGLSLAAWNALLAAGLAGVAWFGWRSTGT